VLPCLYIYIYIYTYIYLSTYILLILRHCFHMTLVRLHVTLIRSQRSSFNKAGWRHSHEGTLELILAETLKRISHKHALPGHWLEFCDRICTRNPETIPKIWSFPLQNGWTNIPRLVVASRNIRFHSFPRSTLVTSFLTSDIRTTLFHALQLEGSSILSTITERRGQLILSLMPRDIPVLIFSPSVPTLFQLQKFHYPEEDV
jgi:hypothetical protein